MNEYFFCLRNLIDEEKINKWVGSNYFFFFAISNVNIILEATPSMLDKNQGFINGVLILNTLYVSSWMSIILWSQQKIKE